MARLISSLCLTGLVLAATAGACGGTVAPVAAGANDRGSDAGHAGDAHTGLDGGIDAVTPDGDGDDGGLPPCSDGICPSPVAVPGFTPSWNPPTGAHQNLCTAALIDQYYDQCLAPALGVSCADYASDTAHQGCQTCLESQLTDSKWGPLVFSAGLIETNESGCIALLDPTALSCAQAVQAADECEHAACDPVCGPGSDAAFDDWVTCSAAANACGCQSWFQASDCVKSLAGAQSAAAPCLVGQTFEDLYYSVAAVFCGP